MEEHNGFALHVSEHCVKVTGDLDVMSTPEMIAAVTRAMTVELDLSEVTFIDSSGLSGLINLRNSRAPVNIVAVSENVNRVLEVTGLVEAMLTHKRATGSASE